MNLFIPIELQKQALNKTHRNHIRIKKTGLLANKSIYWIGINADIKYQTKNCSTSLDFQQTLQKEKLTQHEIPAKLCEVEGSEVFYLYNKNYLCIVDYYNKFSVVKRWKAYHQTT